MIKLVDYTANDEELARRTSGLDSDALHVQITENCDLQKNITRSLEVSGDKWMLGPSGAHVHFACLFCTQVLSNPVVTVL